MLNFGTEHIPGAASVHPFSQVLSFLVHLQEKQDLAAAMQSAVAKFEAESDAFVAAHNLDKLSLGDAKMNKELALCDASLADSKKKIRLHTEQAENLKQQTMQLINSLEETAEELKGRSAIHV